MGIASPYIGRSRRGAAGLLIFMLLCSDRLFAIDFLALQSKAAGDGWFEYQMDLLTEPLFEEVLIGGLVIGSGSNVVEHASPPENWLVSTNTSGALSSGWQFLWDWPVQGNRGMPRPYTARFRFRSEHGHWKVDPFGALIVMTLWPDRDQPFWSAEPRQLEYFVGYAKFPALIPCAATGADQSGPEHSSRLELVKDPRITGLVREQGRVVGVDFHIDYAAAVQVLASDRLSDWFPVGELSAVPGDQRWTVPANTPLPGTFFKLAVLAAFGSADPLTLAWSPSRQPGRTKSGARSLPGKARPLHLAGAGGRLIVSAATTPGRKYRLRLEAGLSSRRDLRVFTAHSAWSRLGLDFSDLPPTGIISVVED